MIEFEIEITITKIKETEELRKDGRTKIEEEKHD